MNWAQIEQRTKPKSTGHIRFLQLQCHSWATWMHVRVACTSHLSDIPACSCVEHVLEHIHT